MKWWLSVFFYVQGAWIPGSDIAGWDPRPYDTEAICAERKAFAERECRKHPLQLEAVWVCNYGAPAKAPPVIVPQLDC